MIGSLALAVALWPAPAMQHCPPPTNTIVVGIATDAHNKFLYCEHFSRIDEHRIKVNYVKGTTNFATKELDFSKNDLIPNVKQLDSRTGELREANILNSNLILQYKENTNKKLTQSIFPLNEVDVVDAGFNTFIRTHWDTIIKGKTLTINFGAIAHQKMLPLRISAKDNSKCTLAYKEDINAAPFCFWAEADNALLRLLISNIKLNYDAQRRLQQFEGMVNIKDDKHKTLSATIHYFYASDYPEKKEN